jgi:hypothetical protein
VTVKVVATLETLKARHLMVLANQRKTPIASLVEEAVNQYLEQFPVEGLADKPLDELLVNKVTQFGETPTIATSTPVPPKPKREQKAAVEAAAQMPKRGGRVWVDGVKIYPRRVRGEPHAGHINDSARILYAKDITEDAILQAALSQRIGYSFYILDLFDAELWKSLDMSVIRHINKLATDVLTKCKCIDDLGKNSNHKHTYVYLGKQEKK